MNRTIVILVVCLIAIQGFTLSPPQYTLQRQLLYSIGQNPYVTVNDVVEENGLYYIDIVASKKEVAEGLSFILMKKFDFGGLKGEVRVFDTTGNRVVAVPENQQGNKSDIVKTYFENALKDNKYFKQIVVKDFVMLYSFWIEFESSIIQFWNDDLSDLYGNYNEVAAKVFRDVCETRFLLDVVVGFATEPKPNGSIVPSFDRY